MGRNRTFITDHAAIRVADIASATRFYESAFGARVLTEPFEVSGALAEGMLGGPPGARLRMRQIGFDRGVLELVEVAGAPTTGRISAAALNVLHLGVQVDDVVDALDRVVTAGGGIAVPPTAWGTATLCFCTDPDGTVLELADASIDELLVHTRAAQTSPALR